MSFFWSRTPRLSQWFRLLRLLQADCFSVLSFVTLTLLRGAAIDRLSVWACLLASSHEMESYTEKGSLEPVLLGPWGQVFCRADMPSPGEVSLLSSPL